MGIEGLYTVKGFREEDGTVFDVELDPSHAIFGGHFPGMPVLPGVCAMYMIKECASRLAGTALRYAQVQEVKFLAAVIPSESRALEVRLELGGADADGHRALRGEVAAQGRTMLKIKAELV